jgi:hypothetical protein
MALAGKPSNVVVEGIALLLSTTFQILAIARLYIRALKVADEDLHEILIAINQVPGQVVEPGPDRRPSKWEKLDDKEVVVYPTHPTCNAVIL